MKRKRIFQIFLIVLTLALCLCAPAFAAGGGVAGAVEQTWTDASGQIKTVVDNVVGPSPRTWSLRLYSCSILHHPRSIPTYVGFTYAAFSIGTATTVYPHMRGVYGQRQRHHRARSRSIPAPSTPGSPPNRSSSWVATGSVLR